MFKYVLLIITCLSITACYDANQMGGDDENIEVNISPLTTTFEINGSEFKHFVYTNLNFKDNKNNYDYIENVVFLIHGLSYDAKEQYETLKEAISSINLLYNTVIIAPLFKESEDSPDHLYWGSGFRIGNYARNAEISSFTILDDYLTNYLTNKAYFPNVKRVIICGHSAGGQFVHRYAAANMLDIENEGINYSYVVSNPSSYLYPLPQRWNCTTNEWAIPSTCDNYNSYHYGLENLNSYLSNTTAEVIENQFRYRDVTYLLGELDQSSSDKKCGAMWQEGEGDPSPTYSGNRFKRGTIMYEFFQYFYPGNTHKLEKVPNVGHDAHEIFTSATGKVVLQNLLIK